MDIVEQLEALKSQEALDPQQVKVLAEQAKQVITGLKAQEETANSKLQEAITSRDKAKQLLQGVKGKLGLEETAELDLTLLENRLTNRNEDVKKVEEKYSQQLQEVSAKAEQEKQALQEKIGQYEKNMQVMKMQTELSKVQYNALDNNADKLVKNLLGEGAVFEDGTIIYKVDGVVQKNSNGINMSVQDRLINCKILTHFYSSLKLNQQVKQL